MASQGRSIEAVVTLDLKPFQTKITEINTLLKELGNGINIDFGASKLAHQMDDLKKILHSVGEEAEKITTAFNKIEGMSRLLESLGQVKSKLEYIQNDIDKINQSILKESQEVKKVASAEEKVVSVTQKRATALGQVGRELIRQGNEIKKNLTYEEEMIATENLFKNGLAEEMSLYAEKVQLQEQIRAINESDMAIRNGIATNVKDILAMTDEELMLLREELALEEQILGVEKQQTSEQKRQNSARTQGNQLDSMSYLPRRIGSMALTMWGFNEIMDIYETTTANLNARGSMKYFGDQLMTDNRYLTQTNQTLGQVRRSLGKFGTDLDTLQKKYQKIDMTVIGANAEESAYKYGVEADKLGDLAEAYAIYGSEFVKQGRTQEDSVLAINDALDGEVRRLKEVNIKMDDLVAHGYDGSTASLVDALNEIAKERGYDVTAQNITNLSDAITVLELKISQGLASAFEYIEPLLREVAMDFIYMIDAISWAFGKLNRLWIDFATWLDISFGVQNVQKFGSSVVRVLGAVVTLAITFGIVYKVVKGLKGMIKGLFGMLGKGTDDIAKTTGDVAKTGGTVGKDSGGGFRDNFMKQWSKTGKDIGKMARVFADVVVGMAMAFVVIEEAILIISGIGYTYEALKPQFESGIEFIKEFGIWFALLGGAMLVLSYAFGKVPDSAMESIGKGAVKLATGMAIAMGLIAEAIVLLNLPLLAIASIGAVQSWQQENIETGISTIRMFANALNYIATDGTIGWFIVGFVAISGILGFTADVVAIPMVVGIATTLLLVAEAIAMLIVPLGAIALLGASASSLGEENIKQGAEAIAMIGRVLKVLSDAMVDLFVVDIATLGVMLTEKATQLVTGKTGLQALTDEIIPSLTDFIKRFNGLDMGEPVDQAKVQAIQQMAIDIPPLFQAIQKVNNAMGTGDAVGNIFGALGGGISGAIGMGLSAKLDQLYNDVRDVMNFANKLGGLSTGGGANANAIQQTANAIAQLKVKLNLFITTISSASSRVQSASQKLGSALTTGFKTGTASFNSTVVSTLAKGISEVQSRYATWLSGGKTSAQKLTDGFKTFGGKIRATIRTEMNYALRELESYQDDFYRKGQALGKQLSDGFESSGGLNVGSPANIARTIAKEMEYSMLALDNGKQLMYRGGQALGQALTNGYNSYGNLRTDVGVLASKGVNSEQLQANAKNIQLNGNQKGKTPQLTQTNINIDMSNSTVIGVQDLDNKIRQAVEKAIVSINSPNGAIGY